MIQTAACVTFLLFLAWFFLFPFYDSVKSFFSRPAQCVFYVYFIVRFVVVQLVQTALSQLEIRTPPIYLRRHSFVETCVRAANWNYLHKNDADLPLGCIRLELYTIWTVCFELKSFHDQIFKINIFLGLKRIVPFGLCIAKGSPTWLAA